MRPFLLAFGVLPLAGLTVGCAVLYVGSSHPVRFNGVVARFLRVFARPETPLVIFLDDLPRTTTGKIMRRALRDT